jgi:hypothetical protein
MPEEDKPKNPGPETVGKNRVVYPIWREDLAEAIIMPLKEKKNA